MSLVQYIHVFSAVWLVQQYAGKDTNNFRDFQIFMMKLAAETRKYSNKFWHLEDASPWPRTEIQVGDNLSPLLKWLPLMASAEDSWGFCWYWTEQEIKRLSGCLQIQIIFVYLHQERDNCLWSAQRIAQATLRTFRSKNRPYYIINRTWNKNTSKNAPTAVMS